MTPSKLAESLRKLPDYKLLDVPFAIINRNITFAKSERSKRLLVLAIRATEKEIMTRKLYDKQESPFTESKENKRALKQLVKERWTSIANGLKALGFPAPRSPK